MVSQMLKKHFIQGTPLGDATHDVAKMWKEARFALAALGDESWGCKDVEFIRGQPVHLKQFSNSWLNI